MQHVKVKVTPAGMRPLLAYSLNKNGKGAVTPPMVADAWAGDLAAGRYYLTMTLTAAGQTAIEIVTTLDGVTTRDLKDTIPGPSASLPSYTEVWVVTVV